MSRLFPFAQKLEPTTASPMVATVNAGDSNTMIGPFTPELCRSIYITATGNGAIGTFQVLRSRDAGNTKQLITIAGTPYFNFSFTTAFTGLILNEEIDLANSARLTYYVSVVLTSGSISFEMFQ